ncbi:hypothetical protein EJ04DRAFT_566772 [Polyplosphaeria fusca]|uniref:Uncharacterized protein n=1 Tax=Polyplosphaeria fusca TaxID=682080 RepID=A0A9P4QV63_9PLEO|nr:hypothetical protein EJ04DRAFT_566772 [Polyplosphaeria fusca]
MAHDNIYVNFGEINSMSALQWPVEHYLPGLVPEINASGGQVDAWSLAEEIYYDVHDKGLRLSHRTISTALKDFFKIFQREDAFEHPNMAMYNKLLQGLQYDQFSRFYNNNKGLMTFRNHFLVFAYTIALTQSHRLASDLARFFLSNAPYISTSERTTHLKAWAIALLQLADLIPEATLQESLSYLHPPHRTKYIPRGRRPHRPLLELHPRAYTQPPAPQRLIAYAPAVRSPSMDYALAPAHHAAAAAEDVEVLNANQQVQQMQIEDQQGQIEDLRMAMMRY